MQPVNVEDYRLLAHRRLPGIVFDYLDGGAEDETGMRHNRAAFAALRFAPRRLVDLSERDTSVELFGTRMAMPVVIAPTGLNGLLWPKGDILLACAAARAGIPFALSTASTSSIETVARAADGEKWFQLYVLERTIAEALARRAMAADYTTLVLTTDVGVNGKRERDIRNGFGMPMKYSLQTLLDGMRHPRWSLGLLGSGIPELANFVSTGTGNTELQAALMSRKMDAGFSWSDLEWLRDLWPHRLVVKGLSRAEDAHRCVSMGVDGVVLSNHGGRQLDSAVAPVEMLQATVSAVRAPVMVDSGIRRGSDIAKAVALGARAVLVGRATLYGLAARGQAGVEDVLAILKDEFDNTLAQIGCARADALDRGYLHNPPDTDVLFPNPGNDIGHVDPAAFDDNSLVLAPMRTLHHW